MDEAKNQMLEEQGFSDGLVYLVRNAEAEHRPPEMQSLPDALRKEGKAALREASELASWAEAFENADNEGKHSIIARLVERIEISPKYIITIKFRVSMKQYTGEIA